MGNHLLPVAASGLAGPARLPGARRFAAEAASADGIEVPDELLAQVEKLCST
jgi:LDH2 family malate/lactate/ureidoglycolate dehydrogenase